MKKIILLLILPLTALMAIDFTMTGGNPLIKMDTSIPIGSDKTTYDREVTVNSILQLENTVTNATVPTRIIITNGIYNSSKITLKGNYSAVHIVAQTRGKVIIQRRIDIYGDHITIEGMLFNGGTSGANKNDGGFIWVYGTDCKILRNAWNDSEAWQWIRVDEHAYRCEIGYNSFINKTNNANNSSTQSMQVLQCRFDYQDSTPAEHYVHHNYFQNIVKGNQNNGYSCVNFITKKDGKDAATKGAQHNLRLEYNLFEEVNGEGEIVSIKANKASVLHNTFKNSKGGFNLRFGNNSIVHGNSIYNCNAGITVSGENHKITNNYIENTPGEGILVRDGDNYWAGYATVKNVDISSNIIKNCKKAGMRFGKLKHPSASEQYPPQATTVSNNILFQGDGDYLIKVGDYTENPIGGIKFSKNIYDGSVSPILPLSGFISSQTPQNTENNNLIMTTNTTGPNAKN